MPSTPDRYAGIREEEGLQLDDTQLPTAAGEIRRVGDEVFAHDGTTAHPVRGVAAPVEIGQLAYTKDGVTFVPMSIITSADHGWLTNRYGQALVSGYDV